MAARATAWTAAFRAHLQASGLGDALLGFRVPLGVSEASARILRQGTPQERSLLRRELARATSCKS